MNRSLTLQIAMYGLFALSMAMFSLPRLVEQSHKQFLMEQEMRYVGR